PVPGRLDRPLVRHARAAVDPGQGGPRRRGHHLAAGVLAPGAGGPAAAAGLARPVPARPRAGGADLRGGGRVGMRATHRRQGLLDSVRALGKGLATTARTMVRPAHTRSYPHEEPELPDRSRGVIALLESNCTSCMLCARECPDWCIYIDSHKETIPPGPDRKSTRLNSSHVKISYAVFCLKT